jgi:hypothetical protein
MNVDVGGLKEDATDYMATAGLKRAGIVRVVTIDLEPPLVLILQTTLVKVHPQRHLKHLTYNIISENDGLVYLLGYLAKKHLKENPEFGCYTHQSNESLNLHSYVLPSWIQSLSFGGLIPPSQICITKVKKNDYVF